MIKYIAIRYFKSLINFWTFEKKNIMKKINQNVRKDFNLINLHGNFKYLITILNALY